jgi:ribonucleoside-diphosphate reductase alpha chain
LPDSRDDLPFALRSPKNGEPLKHINPRRLWQKILELRLETGEPFIVFRDTVNHTLPTHQRQLGLKVLHSDLCADLMLTSGIDHLGKGRTGACPLASVNAEKFDAWENEPLFVEDILRFLDNALDDFIEYAPPELERAKYAAKRERSVGLGVMGFHSLLQKNGLSFSSPEARSLNKRLFAHLRKEADGPSIRLAEQRGPCEDAANCDLSVRFSNKLAIAPTAATSIVCGGVSAGIEPIPANVYTHKTLAGTYAVKNPYLQEALTAIGKDVPVVWRSITQYEGSVQHLDFLSDEQKEVFRTAFEIDQMLLIELAADRAPYICQSQSLNLFLSLDVEKYDLQMVHWSAWEKGVKSLYYCRSKSLRDTLQKGPGRQSKLAMPQVEFDASRA